MTIEIRVISDDRYHRVACRLDETALEHVDIEKAKQVLWHSYMMARMKLEEMEKENQ